ncbi:pyrroline-5-carboxylate reductase [Ligilactobacillus faecis]|uniref:pyrroline-5-carboxylate reductase n=1 Tax=Ligilactobacillus faecis TaxID=762833 RepID=UPI0024688C33|nr:pyrroline-5-carboxylate reductase [Ligilactobacillus faecis]WGN90505.1 pyrroline-5-carboxylate reductase [Ligilactobacillus faecis]
MEIGFIGVGNMAKAIINGWQKNGVQAKINVHSAHKENYVPYATEHGLYACSDNVSVVQNSDIVFLAVKPLVLGKVLAEIKASVKQKKPLIVSMVTGVSLDELTKALDPQVKLIRIMPNVNVEIGEGMTALVANKNVASEELKNVTELFELVGKTQLLPEKDFSTFVALAGSSPAYVYFFIDAMARTGVKYGLSKAQATQIAAQAVLGSAKKVLHETKSPMDLIDDVCSPGGTTIAGLLALEEAGFMTAVVKGLDATIKKDQGQ